MFIGDRVSGRKLDIETNSQDLLNLHYVRTNNKIHTRFPPEPNGFLHIGHAKSININFNLITEKNVNCYLRYDDTNPSTEEKIYIDQIKKDVEWLGFTPFKITYSSDYFDKIYELAIKLIEKNDAYVCKLSQEEIKEERNYKRFHNKSLKLCNISDRDRSIEENLKLFEGMKNGTYNPGEATLRLRIDMDSNNPNMWDPIIYRIIYDKHLRLENKWCIYPTYDFAHCIVDSLENIDYSCCTLEFENRRDLYYWILNKLDMYKPIVREYSRLNVEYNVLSKRKIIKLINDKTVNGWDDPRLLTLIGLQRRGVPPSSINKFCKKIGITRSKNLISPLLLNKCILQDLNEDTMRTMVVLNPLKITLYNLDEDLDIQCPHFPHKKDDKYYKTYTESLSRTIYIEREDFQLNAPESFYGLTLNKTIKLKYAYNITCEKVITNENQIVELICSIDINNTIKIKHGHIHWCSSYAIPVEIRLYDNLFTTKNAEKNINFINRKSLIIAEGLAPKSLIKMVNNWDKEPWDCRLQFERIGYFCVDIDSNLQKYIFNQIIPLRKIYK